MLKNSSGAARAAEGNTGFANEKPFSSGFVVVPRFSYGGPVGAASEGPNTLLMCSWLLQCLKRRR